MAIKLVGVNKEYTYTWPDGNIEIYNAVIYEAEFGDWKGEIVVGFTEREGYGKLRKRAIVFINGHPEAEFVGTDDYDKTGHLAALIKRPDGKFMRIDEIDRRYAGFNVVNHSSQIREGREGFAALLVSSDDHKTMIQHALIQWEWRRARRE
jgi:hypothetical protein